MQLQCLSWWIKLGICRDFKNYNIYSLVILLDICKLQGLNKHIKFSLWLFKNKNHLQILCSNVLISAMVALGSTWDSSRFETRGLCLLKYDLWPNASDVKKLKLKYIFDENTQTKQKLEILSWQLTEIK